MRKRGVSLDFVWVNKVFSIERLWSSLPPCDPGEDGVITFSVEVGLGV